VLGSWCEHAHSCPAGSGPGGTEAQSLSEIKYEKTVGGVAHPITL